MKNKHIEVIVNPASGQKVLNLRVLNAVFKKYKYDWDVSITNRAGDAAKFAKKASKRGSIVVAYGGDGTVKEVAGGLVGTNALMGIIPGGTGNVMSIELGISADQREAAEIIAKPEINTRKIDVGLTEDKEYFVLHAAMGLSAQMIHNAPRSAKNNLGQLAYVFGAFAAIQSPIESTYQLEIDGKKSEAKGVTCIICNAGSIGLPGLKMDEDVLIDDGKLDVFIIDSAELGALVDVAKNLLQKNMGVPHLEHWKGSKIVVTATPKQPGQLDGEVYTKKRIAISVIPQAVNIIVP
ncbi:MAG: diacylglycerol kinase family lipid kinase [Candidatus Dojkabacteria bacterium]|nr:MAG: diacylglycerol kinase family lipid kinase [Candidatus Dojkabacteria bacterium]